MAGAPSRAENGSGAAAEEPVETAAAEEPADGDQSEQLERRLVSLLESAREWRSALDEQLIEAAEGALADARSEAARSRRELEEAEAKLGAELAEARSARDEVRSKLETARHEAHELRDQLASRDAELEQQRTEAADRNDRIVRLSERSEELERALTETTRESERAAAEAAAELEGVRSAGQEEVNRVLDAARREMERLVSSLSESDSKRETLERDLTRTRSALEQEQGRGQTLERQASELQERLGHAGEELNATRQERDMERNERARAERHADEARAEVERERAKREAMTQRLRALLDPVDAETAEPESQPTPGAEAGAPEPRAGAGPRTPAEPVPQAAAEGTSRSQRQADLRERPVRRHALSRRSRDDRPGECVACHRPTGRGSAAALRARGWTVDDGAALCPTCRASGWELPAASESARADG